MRVLEEPAQLVRVAHDVDRANAAVGYVERVGAVAGDRMAHEQTGRAVDRDELEVRLRPVHLAGIAEHELRDAIRAEHGTRRRGRLAAAIGDELRVGVQHRHQLLDVAGDAGLPEAPHHLLRFTTRHGEARTRIAQPAARAREDLPRVRLAFADAPRDLVEVTRHGIAHGVFKNFENRDIALKYLILL